MNPYSRKIKDLINNKFMLDLQSTSMKHSGPVKMRSTLRKKIAITYFH